MIVSTPGVPAAELLSIAAELRRNEICSIAYFGDGKTGLGRQLSYANSQGIPVAVIVGEDELARGVVSIKDLQAGKKKREGIEDREQYRKAGKTGQVTVPRAEAVQCVKELLDAGE